jgi:hypothetical protein
MAPSNPQTHHHCEERWSISGVAQAGGDSLAETLQADDTGRGGW